MHISRGGATMRAAPTDSLPSMLDNIHAEVSTEKYPRSSLIPSNAHHAEAVLDFGGGACRARISLGMRAPGFSTVGR
jgi:hypothetical protein